jgi:hypothetical protein
MKIIFDTDDWSAMFRAVIYDIEECGSTPTKIKALWKLSKVVSSSCLESELKRLNVALGAYGAVSQKTL